MVSAVHAGETDVLIVVVKRTGDTEYHFDVTLRHADTGWDHYADKGKIRTEDDTILGTRVRYHPHVNEQPFTRSLSGVHIPAEIKRVIIRGYDSVHDDGGQEILMERPQDRGDVIRKTR
ncbi:MAG: hypothetical protein K8S27_06575 [Candidatus Omnitrophica bacterium]|nr:hypothetical protein [Candidatus Omnitrophota bacterium]